MDSQSIQQLYDNEYGPDTVSDTINSFREHADRIAYVMALVKELEPESILELGCGKGLLGQMFRWQRGYAPKVLDGVDISTVVINRCTMYDNMYQLNLCEPFQLAQKYDLVLLMEVLEHVPDPVAVMANALRHTKNRLIISTPEEESIDGVIHVRHVVPQDHYDWLIAAGLQKAKVSRQFLPSLFCEKPHWKGWNFTAVEVLP